MEKAAHHVHDHLIETFHHPIELRGMSRGGGMFNVLAPQELTHFSQHVLTTLVGNKAFNP